MRTLVATLVILSFLTPMFASAATKFLEPGGDATFLVASINGFWGSILNAPAVATDFVHGNHIKSIKFRAATQDVVKTATGIVADAGARISFYIYFNALPANATVTIFGTTNAGNTASPFTGQIHTNVGGTAGNLQLTNSSGTQIGSTGTNLLSTGQWYRVSIAYTISSTTVNRFEVFVDGASDISITNASLPTIVSSVFKWGNLAAAATIDIRMSDFYIDNSSSLTDTGNIWVTAKRPIANGTTNGFTTQIGAGGSGVGTGHSPQVNERALSTADGWSMIGAGSAVTEEYNIQAASAGDIDISTATIVDYMGWVSSKVNTTSEVASIIVNNVTTNISVINSYSTLTAFAGSATYPAGTGSDIGIITTTALLTVSLAEAGILVAYIPGVPLASIACVFTIMAPTFIGGQTFIN